MKANEQNLREIAKKVGVRYIEEKRSDVDIFGDNLVTAMYKVERVMGYQIGPDFPLAKFYLILEEIEKDPEFKRK